MSYNSENTLTAKTFNVSEDDLSQSFLSLVKIADESGNFAERIYSTKIEVCDAVNEYGEMHNIVFSMKNSNAFAIHLICKHAGIYRKARIEEEETTDIQDETKNEGMNAKNERSKKSQRICCTCFVKAKPNELGQWIIHAWNATHNHPIPRQRSIFSKYRIQPEVVKAKIRDLFQFGHNPQQVFNYLQSKKIDNITKILRTCITTFTSLKKERKCLTILLACKRRII
ncbi:hypothetical protein RMATCC62417_11749 [Rhizopus microsporus]|nr:hypothetical protein RMATCC62417_11749 [Rhizopus microsporus]